MSAIESPKDKYPAPSDDLLWGGQEVADYLGISLDRLYYLIRVKRLPVARLGRKTLLASKKQLSRAIADTLSA
jgi:excisionase family DNA binding protein